MDRPAWLFPREQLSLRQERTLQLQRPFGQTARTTLIVLVLLLGIAELMARSAPFQAVFADPSMGSRHYQLGRKLARLEALKREGPIDCLVIGSSMVDVGFDPQAFQAGYLQTGGRPMRCFNFGIDASTAASAAALAHILVEDYQPRLLIYGTDARDYTVSAQEEAAAVILDTNWVRYRLGHFSLDGWLLEHSYLYRYKHYLFRLSRFQLEDTLRSQTKLNFEITPYGFTPLTTVSTYIHEPPDPQDTSFEMKYNRELFSTYSIRPENLSALEKIVSHSGEGTRVIVTEMPVSDGLYYFFGNGRDDYQSFVQQVDALTHTHQILFWQTNTQNLIPDDGWSDYSHLNTTGAEIFSRWLGHQVGQALTDSQR